MQKIYVLLRNNQQTGPYCLQELIQFDLKPYDLIWIEGNSAGWYYPQEIGALHPYLRFLPQKQKPVVPTTAKPVFVAPPEVKKEAAPPVQPFVNMPVPKEVEQPYTPSSKNLEEAVYAQFVQPAAEATVAPPLPVRPKKKAPPTGMVALATILVVGGVFAASWLMKPHAAEETTTEAPSAAPVQNEVLQSAVAANDNTTRNHRVLPVARQKQQSRTTTQQQSLATPKHQAFVKQATRDVRKETGNANPMATVKEEANTNQEANTGSAEEIPAPQPEKKKSLRDKFFDLFKKKPAEEKTEEARPVNTENGERQAKRRDDGTNLAQMVSVRFDIPNSWMMGIKGAKAILVNRSNEAVWKAVIEVSYYNDDNELLQKKVVNFTSVGGRDSKTIAIPDHPTATKVAYSIVSVEGKPAA